MIDTKALRELAQKALCIPSTEPSTGKVAASKKARPK